MESKKTTLYLDDFHGECYRPKINVVIRYLKQSSSIGVKYTRNYNPLNKIVNWLYDIREQQQQKTSTEYAAPDISATNTCISTIFLVTREFLPDSKKYHANGVGNPDHVVPLLF